MEHANKDWMHYVKNIIAADVPSAVFLASYLRYTGISRHDTASLEIIDLQKYKVISDPAKVRKSLNSHNMAPFIFIVGKN